MNHMDQYRVSVPAGISGDWEVSKFSVNRDESMISSIRDGSRYVREGEYTQLSRNGYLIMSDTDAEIRDHLKPIRLAKGRCLVNGLGLGMVTQAMLRKSEVDSVTVIEQSPDVISLVEPHYRSMFGDRLTVICEDAFEYKPPKGIRFDVVWHDIWDDLCTDNLEQMAVLHRKYGRRCDWQGSWAKELLKHKKRHEDRQFSYWR